MNPYVNSLNGWGGGFIAFWPSVGIVAAIVRQIMRQHSLASKLDIGI